MNLPGITEGSQTARPSLGMGIHRVLSSSHLAPLAPLIIPWGFHHDSDGKESACNAGDPGLIPGQKDPLEKEMAPHSSVLA